MPHQSRVEVMCCRECGARRNVDPATPPAPCAAPRAARGFVIDQVEVTFLGRCPACVELHARGHVPEAG